MNPEQLDILENIEQFRHVDNDDSSFTESDDDTFTRNVSVSTEQEVPKSLPHTSTDIDDIRNFADNYDSDDSRLNFNRTDMDSVRKQIVFVDPQTKDVIKSMNSDLKQVKIISRNLNIEPSDDAQFIVSANTLEITLPKISSETQRAVGDMRYANSLTLTAVAPTVSHVLKASKGDSFITGSSSRRIRGGETKKLYGINGVWYDA